MSLEEAKEAVEDLYKFLDRGKLLSLLFIEEREDEIREEMVIDGYLKIERGLDGNDKVVFAEKIIRVRALVEALAEFSTELKGKPQDYKFEATLEVLIKAYEQEMSIVEAFIKKPEFLKVYRERLNENKRLYLGVEVG